MKLNETPNKKIVILTKSYPSKTRSIYNGGVEKVVTIMAQQTSGKNEVSILTQKNLIDVGSEDEPTNNPKVYRVGNPLKEPKVTISLLINMARAWINYMNHSSVKKCDFIIAADHSTYIPGVLASIIHKKKLIIFWHDLLGIKWLRYFGIAGLGGILSEITGLLYPKAIHYSLTNFTNKKIRKLSVSKKVERYTLSDKTYEPDNREKPPKTNQILMVGRLVNYKNYKEAITLFEKFNKNHKGWNLLIVGQGPEEEKLIKMVRTKGLTNHITIKKCLTDRELKAEYARSKVFLHLSEIEGFSLVISEAINMGCKVIALYLPVYEELYKGKINFLYNKYDYESFANYMLS